MLLLLLTSSLVVAYSYTVPSLGQVSRFNSFCSSSWRTTSKSLLQSTLTTVDADKAYDAEAITVLKGLEPVRKRPGMYIGSTGVKGLHHLVFEVVDNSVDEALAGHCTDITVTLHNDGSVEVLDNGRGIPCSPHPTTGKSSLETVLCVLHAGGKFGGEDSGYKVSGGLHGVGISVVNALSSSLVVEVVRDGMFHSMTFSKGIPISDIFIRPAEPHEPRGTRVRFEPDETIFKTAMDFEFDRLANRFDELAYLNAGLVIHLVDNRTTKRKVPLSINPDIDHTIDNYHNTLGEEGQEISAVVEVESLKPKSVTFQHAGGIKELIETLCADKTNLHPEKDIIYVSENYGHMVNNQKVNINVEVAMRWSKDMFMDNLLGFANGIRTGDGGSHIDGLKFAIAKVVNQVAKKTGKVKEGSIPGEFVREGLTAVISVKVPEPEFEGQTKTRLGNPEVRAATDQIVANLMQYIADWNPNVLNSVITKALEAQAAANAARAARDMVRKKSLLTSTVLPGKLSDCSSRSAKGTEIYLVEGDSAAGSAKQGRDRMFQAILPLRGKILNIERCSNQKIYQNTELQAIISALGLGMRGTGFDLEALRYHKIIIMTDADVDGAHIRLLLLTFLYRYQRELIEGGYVYIACPPLFKVTFKGQFKGNYEAVKVKGGRNLQLIYFYNDEDYETFLKENTLTKMSKASVEETDENGDNIPTAGVQIVSTQRFKGLGEMMALELWETTMNPETRTLKQVTVEDATQADLMFNVLMGENVGPRKEFIMQNAELLNIADLDY